MDWSIGRVDLYYNPYTLEGLERTVIKYQEVKTPCSLVDEVKVWHIGV